MSGTHEVEIGDRGRFVVPARLRHDLGWETGTRLHLLETEGGVVVMTREQLKAFVRADWKRAGRGVLDELLTERRAAAAADLRDLSTPPPS